MKNNNDTTELIELARNIRLASLELCYKKKASHIGGAFSVADILAVLYGSTIDIEPGDPLSHTRDRVFYSKGHACTALYAALAYSGFFEIEKLISEFLENGSPYMSHVSHHIPGVELSTGSLGHALGVSCGSALAAKIQNKSHSIFTILSDGELDEGSNWEAILFAAHNNLDNLVAIVDFNKIQSFGSVDEVMRLEPLGDKFKAFNWNVVEADGHDIASLQRIFSTAKSSRNGMPKVIIAHTIKGKGVSFMEGNLLWHYKSPSFDEFIQAQNELKK